MLFRLTTFGVLLIGLCGADTLTLRSGRVITGQYLGGDARHIRMAIGDHVDTFNVEDVGDIEFGGNAPPVAPDPPPPTHRYPFPGAPAATPRRPRVSRNSNRLRLRRLWPAFKFPSEPRLPFA